MVSETLSDNYAAIALSNGGPKDASALFAPEKSALQEQPASVHESAVQRRDGGEEVTIRQAAPLVIMLTGAMILTVRLICQLLLQSDSYLCRQSRFHLS